MRDHCISPSACLRPTRNTAVFFRLIMAFALFFIGLTTEISGQVCYQQIKNNSGYPESTVSPTLETTACSLKTAVTAPYSSQFAVYSTAIYLHTAQTDQNVDPAIASILATVESSSPYYLLFVKYGDYNGLYKDFKVYTKLPTGGIFSCIAADQRDKIGEFISLAVQDKYDQLGRDFAHYATAEIAGMEKLQKYLEKLAACCDGNNVIQSQSCSLCPDLEDAYRIRAYFEGHGFVKIPIFNVTEDLSARPEPESSQRATNAFESDFRTNDLVEFRQGDPSGSLRDAMESVFNSDLFEGYGDGIKGYLSANRNFCIPGALEQMAADYETSSVGTKLWIHIWDNPEDGNEPCLYVASVTDGILLTDDIRPKLNEELQASYTQPEGQYVYQDRFAQSSAVVIATATSICERHEDNTIYPLASSNDLTGATILCADPVPGAYYFLSPAGVPMKLPEGAVIFFSNNHIYPYDSRAPHGFATQNARWTGCLRTPSNYFLGFYNFSTQITAFDGQSYDFYKSDGNNGTPAGKAWFCFPQSAGNPRQIKEGLYTPPGGILDIYGRGPLVAEFQGVSYTNQSIQINVYTHPATIKHFNDAEFIASYASGMDGTLIITEDNGSKNYYLVRRNYIAENEYYKFNCAYGQWEKLPSDPFQDAVLYDAQYYASKFGPLVAADYLTFQNIKLYLMEKPEFVNDALDFVGMFFPPADLVNAAVYVCQGRYGMAALASFSALPMVGDAGKKFMQLGSNLPGYASKLDNFTNAVHRIQYWGNCPFRPASDEGKSEARASNLTQNGCIEAVLDVASLYDNAVKEIPDNLLADFMADATELETKGLLGRTILESGNAEGLLKAWEVLSTRPQIRKDIATLTSVSKILDNSSITHIIGEADLKIIIDNLAEKGIKCRTCTNGTSERFLDEILDDLEYGAVKYGDNYSSVITGFKQGNNFTEGAMFVAKAVKQHPGNFPVGNQTVFEFTEITSLGVRRVDVQVGNIFYEFKSTSTLPPEGFSSQFIKDLDLNAVTNLLQIKWWFDGKKVTSLNKSEFLNQLENATISQDIINKFAPYPGAATKEALLQKIDQNFTQIFSIIE